MVMTLDFESNNRGSIPRSLGVYSWLVTFKSLSKLLNERD